MNKMSNWKIKIVAQDDVVDFKGIGTKHKINLYGKDKAIVGRIFNYPEEKKILIFRKEGNLILEENKEVSCIFVTEHGNLEIPIKTKEIIFKDDSIHCKYEIDNEHEVLEYKLEIIKEINV